MEWRDKTMAFCTRNWRPEETSNDSRCQFNRVHYRDKGKNQIIHLKEVMKLDYMNM